MEVPPALEVTIREGKAVLVLGAGASLEATGPSGKNPPNGTQLAAMLSSRFLGGNYSDHPLSQVAEYATTETDLITVQDYIRQIFEDFEPTDAHLRLPDFAWWGFATTNFDRLIEKAYAKSQNPTQIPRRFIENGDRVEDHMRDPRSVMLLKLHGCITKTANPRCPLILTTEQYVTHREGRSRIFEHLRNWGVERPFIFIGQSLQDLDLRTLLLEFATSLDIRPRYYAVFPSVHGIQRRHWETKKVTLLEGTFADFMASIDAKIPRGFRSLAVLTHTTPFPVLERLRHREGLSKNAMQFLSTDVEYVKAITATATLRPRDFYKGINPGWSAIEQQLDVRRHLGDTILADSFLVDEALHRGTPEIIAIKGHAGSGKSVLLRRVAWEAAKEYDCFSLFLNRYGVINTGALQEIINATDARVYLFVDGAAERIRELHSLARNIGPEGRRLTVVLGERMNEWNVSCVDLFPFVTSEHELKYLSLREIDALLGLLEENRALGTLASMTLEDRRAAFVKRAGKQLLVALHEATLGAPFEDIIENEYQNIQPDAAQRIYLSICVLNRLGVPVRAGIIARMHGIPFEEFKSRFFAPLEQVVLTDFDPIARDFMYRTRHPHIADIVFQRVLRNQDARYDKYSSCLRELNIDYSTDRSAFSQMTRGRTVLELFPNHDLAVSLYRTARDRVGETHYLLHQMAIYEMNRPTGNMNASAELLAKASTIAPGDAAIKHSLAEHRLKMAEVARTELEREKLYDEARRIAIAIKGDPPWADVRPSHTS